MLEEECRMGKLAPQYERLFSDSNDMVADEGSSGRKRFF